MKKGIKPNGYKPQSLRPRGELSGPPTELGESKLHTNLLNWLYIKHIIKSQLEAQGLQRRACKLTRASPSFSFEGPGQLLQPYSLQQPFPRQASLQP